MLAHGYEKIEEELASLLHLRLHRSALLEVVTVSYDDSEVVAA